MNPKYGEEMPHDPDAEDLELNAMFRSELAKEEARIAKAGELPEDGEFKKELAALQETETEKREDMIERLDVLNHSLVRFEKYFGDGLAGDMPLGEVIGFLEDKGEKRAAEMVIESLEGGVTAQTPLIQLAELFKKERDDISAILHGETEEVDLDAE